MCESKSLTFNKKLIQWNFIVSQVLGPELSTGRMDPRVGSGHGLAGFWRVGSDFLSAIAGRVGSTFRRVGSGPRKVTRGQLWLGPCSNEKWVYMK